MFLMSRIGVPNANSQCHVTESSIGGMYLRGHVFKMHRDELPEECVFPVWGRSHVSELQCRLWFKLWLREGRGGEVDPQKNWREHVIPAYYYRNLFLNFLKISCLVKKKNLSTFEIYILVYPTPTASVM